MIHSALMHVTLISYIGPETILPVASAFAAIVGAFMFCGRTLAQYATKGYRLVFRRGHTSSSSEAQDDFGV